MTPPSRDELLAWLDHQLDDTIEALRSLVSINSFTANAEGVNANGRLVAEWFGELGFEAEFVPADHPDHGNHLFLTRPGNAPAASTLLLVSHLDTVYPPEEELRHDFRWEPAPEEGRIYGPGTIDIKGGTALLLLTLRGLRHFAPEVFDAHRWIVACNSSEEVYSQHFGERTRERCPEGARAVLVFEGGPIEHGIWQIVRARKGRAVYRITAAGRGAHSGSAHHLGINAITTLAEAILAAARLTDPDAGLTVNVGVVHGGSVVNRVPHEAVAEVEIRAFDPDRLDQTGQALEALARPFRADSGQAAVHVERLLRSPAWPANPGNDALAERWLAAARSLGIPLETTSRGGLSDANYLYSLGPTLDGLGPGGGNAHCSERSPDGSKVPEYVLPATFAPKAAINILAILDLLDP